MRRAAPEDVDDVLAVLNDAAAWLNAVGIEQWPDQFDRDPTLGMIIEGLFRVAVVDRAVAGTYRLQERDPIMWGEDDGRALYLQRLAVRRGHRGHGLGTTMLDAAAAEAHAAGRRFLRVDCAADNEQLRRYYETAGFLYCGGACGSFGSARWQTSLYQREAAPLTR